MMVANKIVRYNDTKPTSVQLEYNSDVTLLLY